MSQIMTATAPLSSDAYERIREEIHRSTEDALHRMDDRTKVICRSRNHLLKKNLMWMRTPYRRGPLKRLRDAIENVWAMLWGMLIVYSEMLGLIKEVEEGDEE